jgi:hypothetical protein
MMPSIENRTPEGELTTARVSGDVGGNWVMQRVERDARRADVGIDFARTIACDLGGPSWIRKR